MRKQLMKEALKYELFARIIYKSAYFINNLQFIKEIMNKAKLNKYWA